MQKRQVGQPGGAITRFRGSPASRSPEGGFTLVELVVIIVLVSILSIVAIPRLLSDDISVTPVADHMAAEIRYAQALAMTHGEAHQFRVGGGTFRITRDPGGCAGGGANVPLSDGESSGSTRGLAVSGSSCVSFSSLFGRPDGSHSIQVSSGGSAATIQVTSETGYVQVQA